MLNLALQYHRSELFFTNSTCVVPTKLWTHPPTVWTWSQEGAQERDHMSTREGSHEHKRGITWAQEGDHMSTRGVTWAQEGDHMSTREESHEHKRGITWAQERDHMSTREESHEHKRGITWAQERDHMSTREGSHVVSWPAGNTYGKSVW